MRAHVGRNVFVHLAPIEVGNATRTDVNSSTLQKESKHVKLSSGALEEGFRKRAHISSCLILVHVGVGQRCCARDEESPAILPTMSTRNVPAGR